MIEIKDKNGKDLNIGDTVILSNGNQVVISSIRASSCSDILYFKESIGGCVDAKYVELVEPDSWDKFEGDLENDLGSISWGYVDYSAYAKDYIDRAKKLANHG